MPCPHFGNLPVEYNRSIHGPYYPFRYYGKLDTPLAEVKVSELSSWLSRRNVHPVAVFQCLMRTFYRAEWRFIHPRYAFPGVGWNMKIWSLVVFFYFINYKTLRHHKRWKYHW